MENQTSDQINTAAGDPVRPNPDAPVDPEKNVPTKPDTNPDPTKIAPGYNQPEKNDPTRIKSPPKQK